MQHVCKCLSPRRQKLLTSEQTFSLPRYTKTDKVSVLHLLNLLIDKANYCNASYSQQNDTYYQHNFQIQQILS